MRYDLPNDQQFTSPVGCGIFENSKYFFNSFNHVEDVSKKINPYLGTGRQNIRPICKRARYESTSCYSNKRKESNNRKW